MHRVDAAALAEHDLRSDLADELGAEWERLGQVLLPDVLDPGRDDPGLDVEDPVADDAATPSGHEVGVELPPAPALSSRRRGCERLGVNR